jgi:hypothetical protein
MHNIWLQQLGKNDTFFYTAIYNDFVQDFK